ncbi:MAG: hypothetical protein E7631_08215 [Ruminococcaceae bacterium]|nr:hypothetical protein [Oscillospiraceae bacterium]
MKKIISAAFELDLDTGLITWTKDDGSERRRRFKGNMLKLLKMLSQQGYTENTEKGTIVFANTLKSDIQKRIWDEKGDSVNDRYSQLFKSVMAALTECGMDQSIEVIKQDGSATLSLKNCTILSDTAAPSYTETLPQELENLYDRLQEEYRKYQNDGKRFSTPGIMLVCMENANVMKALNEYEAALDGKTTLLGELLQEVYKNNKPEKFSEALDARDREYLEKVVKRTADVYINGCPAEQAMFYALLTGSGSNTVKDLKNLLGDENFEELCTRMNPTATKPIAAVRRAQVK